MLRWRMGTWSVGKSLYCVWTVAACMYRRLHRTYKLVLSLPNFLPANKQPSNCLSMLTYYVSNNHVPHKLTIYALHTKYIPLYLLTEFQIIIVYAWSDFHCFFLHVCYLTYSVRYCDFNPCWPKENNKGRPIARISINSVKY